MDRSARLWAELGIGFLDGWDLDVRMGEWILAHKLWQLSVARPIQKRRKLLEDWWVIERTFSGLPGPTLWPQVCDATGTELIPVWEVPGYSQLGNFKTEAIKQGYRWVLTHPLEPASNFETGAASSREMCGGISKGRVCFTARGLRAGVYVVTTTYDRVGLIREVRWRQRW